MVPCHWFSVQKRCMYTLLLKHAKTYKKRPIRHISIQCDEMRRKVQIPTYPIFIVNYFDGNTNIGVSVTVIRNFPLITFTCSIFISSLPIAGR